MVNFVYHLLGFLRRIFNFFRSMRVRLPAACAAGTKPIHFALTARPLAVITGAPPARSC